MGVDALNQVDGYLPSAEEAQLKLFGKRQGQVMSMLSIFVWCLVVGREMRGVVSQMLSILELIRRRGLVRHSQLVLDGDAWALDKFSLGRVSFAIFLALTRLWLAAYLFQAGLEYLVHTIDLRDL